MQEEHRHDEKIIHFKPSTKPPPGAGLWCGNGIGHVLRAFDIETGRELWRGRLPAGGQASPMTYQLGGRQYVVIAAGGHATLGTRRGDHLVAFALAE